ncbi:MFS transporter [Holzapfeliella sp. JNUCC 80]
MKVNKKWLLAIILLSYFMILLDNSIIFTGTVKIAEELKLTPTILSWVSNAYSLTFGGLLLIGGRLGDTYGKKRVFLVGLILFGLGSLLVGIGNTGLFVILARGFQGVGSAILAPTTLSLLMTYFKGEARTKAISAYGAMGGIGASLGLVIGGLFASLLSWRDGFLMNVPIAILMIIMTTIVIPETKKVTDNRLDYIGAIYSFVFMVSLVYAIVGNVGRVVSAMLAVIFVVLFIRREARVVSPLTPLRLFANSERLGAYLTRFFYLGAMLSMWFLTPQIMQTQLNFTPLQAGLGFFPLTIVNFVVALGVAKLTKKFGNTRLLIVGTMTTTIGMLMLTWFTPQLGYVFGIAVPMLLMGAGQGLTLSPLTVAGVAYTDDRDSGSASGVINVAHQLGGSVGVSLTAAVIQQIDQPLMGYHVAMTITTIFLVLSVFIVVIFIALNQRK